MRRRAGILLPALSGAAWAGRHGAGGRGFAILTAGFGVGQVLGPLAAGYFVSGGSDFTMTLFASAGIVGLGLFFLVLAAAYPRHRETSINAG